MSRSVAVSWQRCPICVGTGVVSRPPGVAHDQSTFVSTSCGPWPCPTCNGTRMVIAKSGLVEDYPS